MNLQKVKNFLKQLFSKPLGYGKRRHIVFWYDSNKDFIEDIDDLDIKSVKIIKLTDRNAFKFKYYIEKENTTDNILIYSNLEKPLPQEDWLYDIYRYSEEFSTDRAAVIMRELNIKDPSFKEKFKFYNAFFRSKERITAFKNLSIEDYTEEKIDIGVLAVLTKVKIMDMEEILKSILKDYLDGENKIYESIGKFGNLNSLWDLITKYYGYGFEKRNLGMFMAMLLITNMESAISFQIPKQYKTLISSKKTNCIVFVNHFMNSSVDEKHYDKMQQLISNKLKINMLLNKNSLDTFIDCDIFDEIDRIILLRISNLLENGVGEYSRYLSIISRRRTAHFYRKYENEYKTLKWTINMLNEKEKLNSNIKEESSFDMFKSYVDRYYYFDEAYRKFYYHYDSCKCKDELKDLKEIVENLYNNWYLKELSIKWFNSLEGNKNWRIEGLNWQNKFYEKFVEPSKERVFVIISDRLRYESARELFVRLNNGRKGKVEIEYMQGVIPSCTKLGMASLLPNTKVEIDDKYDVLVDGINSSGTENRDLILKDKDPKSLAVRYDDVMVMNDIEIRKNFVGMDVVYIYHDEVDTMGDNCKTEGDVFSATELAFDEIISLVNKLVNRVSAASIIITADHGYLYRRSGIQKSDKISCVNYVHDGAMLQEMVIPLIKFKNDRSAFSVNDIRKAKISLTSISRKITNIIIYLEFFQEERIQDKVIVQKIKCYFEDKDGNRISNENIIIGNSVSENPKERTYREKFVLKSMHYDKKEQYFLIIQDADESNKIYEKIPYTIDVSAADEFDF
ncbi:PglZ domain protein [Clostridiaceae bacterium BL-3]|nr:PglZ domain protein [Clostridiaceae bacterium BL-3]